jgi:hypothetical protein
MYKSTDKSRGLSNTGTIILAIVITAIVVGGGVYLWQNKSMSNQYSPTTQTLNSVSTPTATSTPSSPQSNPIAGWLTYTNTKYGYQINYPSDWTLKQNRTVHPGAEGVYPVIEYLTFLSPNKHYYLEFGLKRDGENIGIVSRTGTGGGNIVASGEIKLGDANVTVDKLIDNRKVKLVFYDNSGAKGKAGVSFVIGNFDGYAEFGSMVNVNYDQIDIGNAPELDTANQILSTFKFTK